MPVAYYAATENVFTGKVVCDELEVRKVETYSVTNENVSVTGDVSCVDLVCSNVEAGGLVEAEELVVQGDGAVYGDLQVGSNEGGGSITAAELTVTTDVNSDNVIANNVTAETILNTPVSVLGGTVRSEVVRTLDISGLYTQDLTLVIKYPVRFDVSGVWQNGIGEFSVAFMDLNESELAVLDGIFFENESSVSGEDGLTLQAAGWCKFDLSLGIRRDEVTDQTFGEFSVLYYGQTDNPTGTGLKRRVYTFSMAAIPVKIQLQFNQESGTSDVVLETKNFQLIE